MGLGHIDIGSSPHQPTNSWREGGKEEGEGWGRREGIPVAICGLHSIKYDPNEKVC